jgi:hypothetical protein
MLVSACRELWKGALRAVESRWRRIPWEGDAENVSWVERFPRGRVMACPPFQLL